MVAFTYRCPRTGLQVQGWTAADELTDGEFYEPVTCIACGRVHLIDAKSAEVLGPNGDNGELADQCHLPSYGRTRCALSTDNLSARLIKRKIVRPLAASTGVRSQWGEAARPGWAAPFSV
jgi:hypothetical protein